MTEHGEGSFPPLQKPRVSGSRTESSRQGESSDFAPSWILHTEDELTGTDPRIQRTAKLLNTTPGKILTPDFLTRHFERLQDWVIEGEVPESEATMLLTRIGEKIEELSEKGERIVDEGAGGRDVAQALKETLGTRIDPQLELSRWVDSEYTQEFYTRFDPRAEPRFYTEATSQERAVWDARWRLARAAYYKRECSETDKQANNPDLIALTREQMETLYRVPGVRVALEWYASAIITGTVGTESVPILECESGSDFEEVRSRMRNYLKRRVFRVSQQQEGEMSDKEKNQLEIRLKSADAVAWNLIYCGNLVESTDSRYSYSGERHGGLAPALCSDDIRSVLHPQEKWEAKARSGQEWGVYGRWGKIQVGKIKEHLREGEEIVFKAAESADFWRFVRTREGLVISAPECYPTTTTRSFFESYKDGDNGRTLLERLLGREEINWREVQADPWKTSYLTVKLRKAVALYEHFTGEVKPGWSRKLMDIFTRLGLEKELGPKKFHNLKVWAAFAAVGGVARPQDRVFTAPFGGDGAFSPARERDRITQQKLLRKDSLGYLKPKEGLWFEF